MFSSILQKHVYIFLISLTCITTIVTITKTLDNSRAECDGTAEKNVNITGASSSSSSPPMYFNKASKSAKIYENYMPTLKMRYSNENGKYLYFLGLFELSTMYGVRREGESEASAASLAIKHINNKQILPGYVLKLLINNTKCDPGVGVDRFFHSLYSNKTVVMLLGTGCSNVTERLAHIVVYWNILQVSFGSTSPSLSDRNKFPLFFRTVAPDSSHNLARVAFIKHFRWTTVATFSQSENTFLLPLNNLVAILENANITCTATVTFSLDNYKEQLNALKNLDTRIIIGSFSAKIASKIFCEAYDLKMYGHDYVWILHEPQFHWWDVSYDCDRNTLSTVTEGIIMISDYNAITENVTSISGLTNDLFEYELNVTDVSKYARHTYDAVWAMALTLRKVQDLYFGLFLSDFTYRRKDMVENFVRAMGSLDFMGVSGPIKFVGADRIGNSIFKQIQGNELKTVAIFYPNENHLDFNCSSCQRIKWQGDKVPIAQRVIKLRLITVPKAAFYAIVTVSAFGITACLTFLYFNLHFRRMKTLKLSSPMMNNVAILGCMLVYTAVILLGVDKATLFKDEYFSQLCTIRVYLLAAGFSLAFGSMFAKTYRVHRIFTYSCTSLVKDKILKDKQLIALILLLLLIDASIVAFWVFVDPLRRELHNLTMEISSEDRGVVYQPQVEVCECNNTRGWFLVIYGYKGFLLIMGVYMAWETRNVKIQALNESQYIGICVYSAVSSAIVVLLSNFLSQNTIISYLSTTFSILISTTITLFLMFLPKLRIAFGQIEDGDPVMGSMGLKFESNTRRLMTEDPNELTYRLEVQNKVYRCELEALDREIARLEEILASPPSTKSSGNQIATDCKPIVLLAVPTVYTSRGSWPSTCKHAKSETSFRSENRLCKEWNENFDEKLKLFDRLKNFFGSIPSVWLTFPHESKDCILRKGKREKPKSNPEVGTNPLVCENLFLKAKSAVSIISKNELNPNPMEHLGVIEKNISFR